MALRAAKCDKDAPLPCNEINGLRGVVNGAVDIQVFSFATVRCSAPVYAYPETARDLA
jgi:hypothetical protein